MRFLHQKLFHMEDFMKKYGLSFFLLLFGIIFILPLIITLIIWAFNGLNNNLLALYPILAVFCLLVVIMLIGYGSLSSFFVKRTAKKINDMDFEISGDFSTRTGRLYIDVPHGQIAFISSYNPFIIQVFSAECLNDIDVKANMNGIRFYFSINNKKIRMDTLLTNRMINLKSDIALTAISKADTFANLLKQAKQSALDNKK